MRCCAGWALLALLPATMAAAPAEITGQAMGTIWSVRLVSPPGDADRAALATRLAARLEGLEQQFSLYRPDSELSRFNHAGGDDWIRVSPELAHVAAESRRLSALTEGAFDPTVAPLLRLWGFGPAGRPEHQPNALAITAARRLVGWGDLEVDEAASALRRRRPGLTADFASMAKGYAVDEIARMLVAAGWRDFLVRIGGDLRAEGRAAPEREWRAGIESPRAAGAALAGTVGLAGEALSTAGNYRNTVLLDGETFGHILDPRTGRPVNGPLLAVSVVHASCAQSSAWATALFVLGRERGGALARERKIACAFFVPDGAGWRREATPEFAALLR